LDIPHKLLKLLPLPGSKHLNARRVFFPKQEFAKLSPTLSF
jgi:hypothetical protein